MEQIDNLEIKDASSMSEMERLEAMFKLITHKAIDNYQKELEVAQAMGDEDAKRLLHIQISMFRHLQSIFGFSKRYATDARWQNDGAKQ
jgi:aspartyl/asparaginyl-tRNA synthetase